MFIVGAIQNCRTLVFNSGAIQNRRTFVFIAASVLHTPKLHTNPI